MSKPFSLAGLLRLRHTEQDAAGAALARANARVRDNAATEKRARRALAEFGDEATSTETLRAIAASRQASAVLLSELLSVSDADLDELATAQDAYNTARARSVGLEKLEHRHHELAVADELKAEQAALDEIAGRARTTGEAE